MSKLEKKYVEGLDEKAKEYPCFAIDGTKHIRQEIEDLLNFSKAG